MTDLCLPGEKINRYPIPSLKILTNGQNAILFRELKKHKIAKDTAHGLFFF